MQYILKDSPAYKRAILALFLGSFVTFAVLYCTQPLLPILSQEFNISPAVASMSVSIATGPLAISMLLASVLSDSKGRRKVMMASLFASAVLAMLAALSRDFSTLLLIRALQGAALAGFPATAMAYVSEEFEPGSTGLVMGMYVSGTSIGGLAGRVIVGIITDYFSWRTALGFIGVTSLLVSVWFWLNLPMPRNFAPKADTLSDLLAVMCRHLKQPGLLCCFAIGFAVMGGFVTLYNYIGYLLMAPPYNLSQTVVGSIFVLYLVGTFSSAWMGRLADLHRRHKIAALAIMIMLVGALITLNTDIVIKVLGIAVFTFGFFGAHSVASGWVGRLAVKDKAQASSLYLLFYYTGSSIAGVAGGVLWSSRGWNGVVEWIVGLLTFALAMVVALRLYDRHNNHR